MPLSPRLQHYFADHDKAPVIYKKDEGWVVDDMSWDEALEMQNDGELHLNALFTAQYLQDQAFNALAQRPQDPAQILPSGYATIAVSSGKFEPVGLWEDGYLGSGVRVVVVDSGGPGAIGVRKGDTYDNLGHGTMVGDIISGPYVDTEFGPVRGNAPNVDIRHIKLLDDDGSATMSEALKAMDIIESMEWETPTHSPLVVNFSFGRPEGCDSDCPLCMRMVEMAQNGTTFIAAVGNGGRPHCPATSRATMSVGSRYYEMMDEFGEVVLEEGPPADFSSRGPGQPDIYAAGGAGMRRGPKQWVGARSTGTLAGRGLDGYGVERGTSFAAPAYTGLVALLYERGLAPSSVRRALSVDL